MDVWFLHVMCDNSEPKVEVSPFKSFWAGGFGGMCTVATGHPLDTLKVRLQTMPRVGPGETPLYNGLFDCARKTITKEGFLGLYKGMFAPLLGVTPMFSVCFLGFNFGKEIFSKDPSRIT